MRIKVGFIVLGEWLIRGMKLLFIDVEIEEEEMLSGGNEGFCFNYVIFYSLLEI